MTRYLFTHHFPRLFSLAAFSSLCVLAGNLCLAQPVAPATPAVPATPAAPAATAEGGSDSKPASTNNVGQQYPRVDSQMRVTFRTRAANAQKIQIQFSNPLDPKTPF